MTREACGAASLETARKSSDTFAKHVALWATLCSTPAAGDQLHGRISRCRPFDREAFHDEST